MHCRKARELAAEKLHCASEDTKKIQGKLNKWYKENKFKTENVKRQESANDRINEKGLFSILVDS